MFRSKSVLKIKLKNKNTTHNQSTLTTTIINLNTPKPIKPTNKPVKHIKQY